jgi:VCBS repeat protein
MRNAVKSVCLAVLLWIVSPAFGQATGQYSVDFESGAGDEWSERGTASLDAVGTFLGPFGEVTDPGQDPNPVGTSLSVSTSERGVYALKFDVIIFDGWDRTEDQFQVKVRNYIAFRNTFAAIRDNRYFNRNTMWLDRYDDLGYGPGVDFVMRDVVVPFYSRLPTETIDFGAVFPSSSAGKGWAIDNVRITSYQGLNSTEDGLTVSWMDGVKSGTSLSQLATGTVTVQSHEAQVAWLPTSAALNNLIGVDNFAWHTEGGIVIPTTGSWKFRVTSTDDAILTIDEKVLISSPGGPGDVRQIATTALSAGTHVFDMKSKNVSGAASLVLEWMGPGSTYWSVVPPTAFKPIVSSTVAITEVTDASGLGALTTRFAMMQGWNDLNGDGYLDMIVGGYPAPILFGNSAGTFTVAQQFQWLYYQIAMADVDNDGDIDLLSAYRGLQENDGGVFTSRGFPGLPITYNFSIAAPDMDSDGRSDLAATLNWSPMIAVNQATDSTAIRYDISSLTSLFSAVARRWYFANYIDADFNNDTAADLFVSSGYTGAGIIVSGEQGYTLRTLNGLATGWFSLYSNSAVADIENDGDLDMFYGGDYLGRSNSMLFNDGSAVLTSSPSTIPDTVDRKWNGAAFGDIDNDGDQDLLIRSLFGSRVELRLNNGDGTFATGQRIDSTRRYPFDAAFVDYDNDGDLDISITSYAGVALFRNDTNGNSYLKVRLVGAGDGATNVAGVGTRVELLGAQTRSFLARRDIASTNGSGAGPFWLHFGGVDPAQSYIVRVHFLSGVREVAVVPSQVTTQIGSTIIAQMVTIKEAGGGGRRVTQWKATDQRGTIRAALKAEARRRGLTDQVVALRESNQLTIRNLLQLLGASNIRDALGSNAAVLSDLNRDPRRNDGRSGSRRSGSRGNSRAGVDRP